MSLKIIYSSEQLSTHITGNPFLMNLTNVVIQIFLVSEALNTFGTVEHRCLLLMDVFHMIIQFLETDSTKRTESLLTHYAI